MESTTLYDFQLKNPKLDPLIKHLLRSYGGIYNQFVRINEKQLGMSLNASGATVSKQLKFMANLGLLSYEEQKETPYLTFLIERVQDVVDREHLLEQQKERNLDKLEAFVQYIEAEECRNQVLCGYFGEDLAQDCGVCDVCLAKIQNAFDREVLEDLSNRIIKEAQDFISVSDLLSMFDEFGQDTVETVIRLLIANEHVMVDGFGKIKALWKST